MIRSIQRADAVDATIRRPCSRSISVEAAGPSQVKTGEGLPLARIIEDDSDRSGIAQTLYSVVNLKGRSLSFSIPGYNISNPNILSAKNP
jgi:hypothetical protein